MKAPETQSIEHGGDGSGFVAVQPRVMLHHGDALEVLKSLREGEADAVITDPPYPNNAGHFDDAVDAARLLLRSLWPLRVPVVLVFWSELETPFVPLPLVAKHIWHRANVNGRPYEAIYHYAADGEKRRSNVIRTAVPFKNATGGIYHGHPTEKSVEIMDWCIRLAGLKAGATVLDPFMGSGTTGVAAMRAGCHFIGVEQDAQHFGMAKRRIEAEQSQTRLFDAT